MKVWVTNYALSDGIEALNGETVNWKYLRETCGKRWFKPGDWHTTEAAAIAKAEQMRIAKIASLRKQIATLEKLTFEIKSQ